MMSCVSQQEKFKLANEFVVANGGKNTKTLVKIACKAFFAFVFTCLHGRCVRESRRPSAQGFMLWQNFATWRPKKKHRAGESNK
jgi:hypothetical protein